MHRTGVYEIRNTVNGHVYVGSAVNFTGRLYAHHSKLRRGKHHSPHLQAAWNKYGEGAFKFSPLVLCSPENRLLYEQLAIVAMRPEYNVSLVAASPMSGRKHSEETKRRMSELRVGKTLKPHSLETRARLSALARQRAPISEVTRRKLSLAAKNQPPRITSPETAAKISAARTGNQYGPHSVEHIAKRILSTALTRARTAIIRSNDMDFTRVLREAGLTKIEYGIIYGVSRQSIHGWAAGHPPRANSLLARQAEVITQALLAAVERGLLPFEAMDKVARRERVTKMAVRLQGLKPAPVR